VEYALTESGNGLLPVLQSLQIWAVERKRLTSAVVDLDACATDDGR